MHHPFTTRALNKGAHIVYTDVGSEVGDSNRYWYDATIHQEYGETLKSMAPCLFHSPNRHDQLSGPVFGPKSMLNTGYGDGQGATNMPFNYSPDLGSSPQQGPEHFEKRGLLHINNAGLFRETAEQSQLTGGSSVHNPAGLSSFTGTTYIVWFKHDNYLTHSGTGNRAYIFSSEDKGAGSGDGVAFSLEANSGRLIWSIGSTDYPEPCGGDTGANEWGGTWCSNDWIMAAMTITDGSRVRTYRNGKQTGSWSVSLPTFPVVPAYCCYFNRTKDSVTAGMTQYTLGPVSILDREVSDDDINTLWNAMWRTTDTTLPGGETVETFSQAPEQSLRRSDLAHMGRIRGTASWNNSANYRNVDEISHGNGFRNRNLNSTGFSLLCMQQLAGEPVSTEVVSTSYIDTTTQQYSVQGNCCHLTSLGDLFVRDESGLRVSRTRGKAKVLAWGKELISGDIEQYDFESLAGFLEQGDASTGALGQYGVFAVTMKPSEVRFLTVNRDDHVATVSPVASHMPSHDGIIDTPHPPQGLGKDDRFSGGNQDDDFSVYGPMAVFGKGLEASEVRELERIALGQAPLRSRRPTRGLLRQTALMAPGRILE